MQSITILGSTGSIGCNTVDILQRHRARYSVQALTAMQNVQLLAQQAKALGAKLAVIGNPQKYAELKELLAGSGIEAAAGEESLTHAASRPADTVVAAIVGAAGLKPAMAAISRGVRLAIANKECLVMAGELMLKEAQKYGATLMPVDSEHSGIFQALNPAQKSQVASITLTASGGPFRNWSTAQLEKATPQQAVKHPNWSMGAKISVDSATLMNKGLELIEACYLFDMPQHMVEIVVHPESIIHALVRYCDGSVIAQLSPPDMRTPIAYALSWPERIETTVQPLDLIALKSLTFEPLDNTRFPAPALARSAVKAGGSMPAALNAANETAVEAFLQDRMAFTQIVKTVEKTLEKWDNTPITTLEDALEADRLARIAATSFS